MANLDTFKSLSFKSKLLYQKFECLKKNMYQSNLYSKIVLLSKSFLNYLNFKDCIGFLTQKFGNFPNYKLLTVHVCENKQKQVTRWRRSRNLKSCKFDCDFDFFEEKKEQKSGVWRVRVFPTRQIPKLLRLMQNQ